MAEQTPNDNSHPINAAMGVLSYLLSAIRCGERLGDDEERVVLQTRDNLAQYEREVAALRARVAELEQKAAALEAALRDITETARILRSILHPDLQAERWGLLQQFYEHFHAAQAALRDHGGALREYRKRVLLEAAEFITEIPYEARPGGILNPYPTPASHIAARLRALAEEGSDAS